jgi:hypothetical protein
VYCRDGRILAHTVQLSWRARGRQYSPGVSLRFESRTDEVLRQVAPLVSHLKWNGIANLDMRIRASDGALVLLEMNPRVWATIYGSFRAGVDFIGLNAGLSNPLVNPAPVRYYQSHRSLPNWLKGELTDFGVRARDPLPELAWAAAIVRGKVRRIHS